MSFFLMPPLLLLLLFLRHRRRRRLRFRLLLLPRDVPKIAACNWLRQRCGHAATASGHCRMSRCPLSWQWNRNNAPGISPAARSTPHAARHSPLNRLPSILSASSTSSSSTVASTVSLSGPGVTFKPKMPPALAAKRYADHARRTALSWLCASFCLPASRGIPTRLSSTLQKDALSALLSIGLAWLWLATPRLPPPSASAASVIGSGNRSRNW